MRRRGAEAIQLLIEATDYLAELPSEPLFRLAFTEVEISEALERILYSGMEDLRDKRTVAVIEQVFEDLTHQHSKAVDYPIDSSSAIRMYLERIWETEVSAVATNMFGNESIQRLELLEPLVLEGIGNIANQIERRPSLKHIRRPRRKNRPQIDINTDLLGVQSPSYEQA